MNNLVDSGIDLRQAIPGKPGEPFAPLGFVLGDFREDSHLLFCESIALELSIQTLIFSTESLLKNVEASGTFPSIDCQEDIGLVRRAQQFGP